MLQSGQILIGDEANKGDGTTPTLIVGHGDTGLERWSATIIGSEGSRISGLKIGENTYIVLHFAVWIDGITVKVSENTFNRNTYGGVKIMNNGTSVIEKTKIIDIVDYDLSAQTFSYRTKDYRYILYPDGQEEFYDLRMDPYEWSSLAFDEP